MYLWLDCETRCPVAPKNGQLELGIEYAEGWEDYKSMGITVCCALDSTGLMRIFGQENIRELQQVVNYATKIVTYNGERFDFPLLEAHGLIIPKKKSCDLYAKLKQASGSSFGLAAYAKKNLAVGKTMEGALAPILWQESLKECDPAKLLRVVDYCCNDVNLTYRLYKLALSQGYLLHPFSGEKLHLIGL